MKKLFKNKLGVTLLKRLIQNKNPNFNPKKQKQGNPKWEKRMQVKKWENLTLTVISTASFCMSGNISALLMMTFLVGVAATAAVAAAEESFRSSELGLAMRGPTMLFFVSSFIIAVVSVENFGFFNFLAFFINIIITIFIN